MTEMWPSATMCASALEAASDFLWAHRTMLDICMVDFITDNVFETTLDKQLAEDLLSLTDEQVAALPARMTDDSTLSSDVLYGGGSALQSFICGARDHTLTALGVAIVKPSLSDSLVSPEAALLAHVDRIMGLKKSHEVAAFAAFIDNWSRTSSVSTLVDMGSGKGYLGQIMSSLLGYRVLAVDAREVNTRGANKRGKNLEVRLYIILFSKPGL